VIKDIETVAYCKKCKEIHSVKKGCEPFFYYTDNYEKWIKIKAKTFPDAAKKYLEKYDLLGNVNKQKYEVLMSDGKEMKYYCLAVTPKFNM